MEIVWSEIALESYFKVIDYLFNQWTEKEVKKFDEKVEALIQRLTSHIEICPKSKLLGYRKCLIDEYNSLIYYIANNKLFLVTFLDNRSSHNY